MSRWFSDVRIASLSATELVLNAPNQIYQLWIEANYLPPICQAIEAVLGGKRRLCFLHGEGESGADTHQESKPLLDGQRRKPRKVHAFPSNLNSRYRFDSFVAGPSNQHAYAVAQAVAKKERIVGFNPLLIHGYTGLGKTHLMHAIGNAVLADRPKSRVIYATGEEFTNDFIQALGDGSSGKFRAKYRKLDLLLIDDIQFFAGKERSQEEFFHTFNTLLDGQSAQVVLSADCSANKLKSLEKRLLSRFEGGMTAELGPPEFETRLAILKRKAAEWNVAIADPVLQYLARRIRHSVRRLEGALVRVASIGLFENKREVTEMGLVDQVLRDFLQEEDAFGVTPTVVQKHVAEGFDLRPQDIMSRRRTKTIALARQVSMYLARSLLKIPFEDIGLAFGRDHGTVIHACKKIEKEMQADEELRQRIDRLSDQILRAR